MTAQHGESIMTRCFYIKWIKNTERSLWYALNKQTVHKYDVRKYKVSILHRLHVFASFFMLWKVNMYVFGDYFITKNQFQTCLNGIMTTGVLCGDRCTDRYSEVLFLQRIYWAAAVAHNQQFVSWVYLYLITAAEENTLISMGNKFSTCVFFESKTNRTSVQTDCTILVFSK